MDDTVGAVEKRGEIVALDVRLLPFRLGEVLLRTPPRQADDLVDGVVRRERAQEARADVAARSGDDDAHRYCFRPIARASSRFDILERPAMPRRRARS